MNGAKNWALTIMLTALAFADFSSELLLKEQMIIPVTKTLNSAGHIDAKLIDFSENCQKNPAKSAVFYWLFLGEVSPQNFPWNRPIFLRICPENPSISFDPSFDFFHWNPAKSADFLRILTFLPRNRPICERILTFFPRNRPIFPRICPWKSREILRFFPRNIRSPAWRFELSVVDCI